MPDSWRLSPLLVGLFFWHFASALWGVVVVERQGPQAGEAGVAHGGRGGDAVAGLDAAAAAGIAAPG